MIYRKYLFLVFTLIFMLSCAKPKPTPRPVGYFRLNLPQKHYERFDADTCPFSFDLPVYSKIVPFEGKAPNNCWFTIKFPQLNAEIAVTYYPITDSIFADLIDDSYTLAYKHSIRADDIQERNFINASRSVYATVFDITGNAASPMQFHITDSVHNFLRGSLYFRVTPNKDSLLPAVQFLEKDIIRLIESFEWK